MTVIWSVKACSKHCPKSFRDEGGYQIVNIVNNKVAMLLASKCRRINADRGVPVRRACQVTLSIAPSRGVTYSVMSHAGHMVLSGPFGPGPEVHGHVGHVTLVSSVLPGLKSQV